MKKLLLFLLLSAWFVPSLYAQRGNVSENYKVNLLTVAVTDSVHALITKEEAAIFAGPLNAHARGKGKKQVVTYRSPLMAAEKKGLVQDKITVRKDGTYIHVRTFRSALFDSAGSQTATGKVVRINGEIRNAQLIRVNPVWSLHFSRQAFLFIRSQDETRAWRQ